MTDFADPVDGWWQQPKPHRFHRCKPANGGWIDTDYVERCACGAIRYSTRGKPLSGWFERNSRKS